MAVRCVLMVRSLVLLLLIAALATPAHASLGIGPGGGTPGTSQNFVLVGHDPLFNRGMNSAAAMYGNYVYVGNRTDSSNTCGLGDPRGPADNCPHPHPGVLIVDVTNPANPVDVGEIGQPYEGNVGITSRELRVWPKQKLLIVMNFRCAYTLHACPKGTDAQFPYDLKFFDLTDPIHPRYISNYVPTTRAGATVKPHEMFLWVDPKNENRALLYISTPTISARPKDPNLMVVDISQVAKGGPVTEIAEGNWNNRYPGTDSPNYPLKPDKTCGPYDCGLYVHSMGLTPDGKRTYLAMIAGEFLVLDTSDIANNAPNPQMRLITDPANRPLWGNPSPCTNTCPNGHSAVQIPGRQVALTTDEVYGTFTDPTFGCPWGWSHTIDVSDPAHPRIIGEYKIVQDQASFCTSAANDPLTEQFTSYSSHNPTVFHDIAIIDWHSGGVQAVNISDPSNPSQAGYFSPTPLPQVATEDPALGRGPNKVIMWSYPIVKNGLIYVVDIRNGLYILRYTGPYATEIAATAFREGNSNLGMAGSATDNVDIGMTANQFTVTYTSPSVGQAWVLFGTGPGCQGLVNVATQDLGSGTTTHTVVVTGNDLPGTVGNIGITPGATYYFEVVTNGPHGPQLDDNGGKCYSVTIPNS